MANKSVKFKDKDNNIIYPYPYFPVGSVFITVNNTNPSTYFGGTWVSFGQGRTLVGVNTSDTDFNTPSKTGGAKTVTLTEQQLPKLSGMVSAHGSAEGSNFWQPNGVFRTSSIVSNSYRLPNDIRAGASSVSAINFTMGNNQAHSNLQPYITVYFWQRTK